MPTCDGSDDTGTAILHKSPGNDLQGIGDGEERVALVDSKCLGLFAEEGGKHHFGRAAAGQELGVENMNKASKRLKCDRGIRRTTLRATAMASMRLRSISFKTSW